MASGRRSLKPIIAIALGAAMIANTAAAKEKATYDLWTMTSDEETVIAVTAHNDAKILSVAAGKNAAALDILSAEEAIASMKVLRDHIDNHSVERILANHKTSDKKRVRIIQREVMEANEEAGSGHEVVIKKMKVDDNTDEAVDIEITHDGDIDDAAIAEVLKAEKDFGAKTGAGVEKTVIQTSENGAGQKLVLVSGADSEAARDFINMADGLTNEERTAMFSDLGL